MPDVTRYDDLDVWADSRGVFVLASAAGDPAVRIPARSVLYFSDRGGWQVWHPAERSLGWAAGATRLVGLSNGSLWLWPGEDCKLWRVDGPAAGVCALAQAHDVRGALTDLVDFYMVDETFGWIELSSEVGTFDGTTVAARYVNTNSGDPLGIWGDRSGVFVLGTYGFFAGESSGYGPRHDIPSGTFSAFWANSRDDQWVSTVDGRLVRFDGMRWSQLRTSTPSIGHAWGRSGELYFASSTAFGRWRAGTGTRVLRDWTGRAHGTRITAIHGSGTTGDVYLAVVNDEDDPGPCGPAFLLWFDGTDFRTF